MEYKYQKNEFGDIVGCDSCDSNVPVGLFENRLLCELCACSFISNATKYPNQYDSVELYQAIAQVGNIILDAVTKRKET